MLKNVFSEKKLITLKNNKFYHFFSESWVELTNNLIQSCSDRLTPPLPFSSGEEYLRLLKEAQRESNQSSKMSSRRDSPKNSSPKSPPNSPNNEPSNNDEDLKGVFINYYAAKVSTMHLLTGGHKMYRNYKNRNVSRYRQQKKSLNGKCSFYTFRACPLIHYLSLIFNVGEEN